MAVTNKKILLQEEDVDEPDFLLAPCFQIDANVELKEVPTTGDEFLLKVMTERRKCKVVTKCDKDISQYAKNQSRFVNVQSQMIPAPEILKPTIEWQNIQVADFSEVRMYVSRMQAKKSNWPNTVKRKCIDGSDCVAWKHFFQKHSPNLTSVFGVSQKSLHNGLAVLVQSLNKVEKGATLPHKTGQWIYSFLAYMELPLLSETVSLLRDLARKCSDIRSHIDINSENATAAAAPLNVFICLVTRYFEQFDLAD